MTVINMLSFGEEGVAVSDEQASSYIRKYNMAQKLNLLNGPESPVIYGGAGEADAVKAVYELSDERINELVGEKGKVSLKEIFEIVNRALIAYKNGFKENVLRLNLGIGLEDLLTGVLGRAEKSLDKKARGAAFDLLRRVDSIDVNVLLGGFEKGRFCIYSANSEGTGRKISMQYFPIGSGAEESDKVLSRYIEALPRDRRDCIDAREGLVKAIEATNSSARTNIGVGGTISIFYLTKERKVIIPGENESRLSSEIVEGHCRGLLDKDFTYDAVYRLVNSQAGFEEMEDKMKKNAKDWKKFDRFLRGYK